GLVEGFVVRSCFAELFRGQHLRAASVTTELGPALLHVVADEPLQELHRLIALLGIAHDRDALAAECSETLAGRPRGIRKVTGALGILVGRRVRERREECEE